MKNFRLLAVTVAVAATLIVILSTSCNTAKKREDNAYRFFRENESKLAALCNDKFPTIQKTIQGKEIIITKHDTITIPGVTLPCPVIPGHKPDSVKCPGQKIVYVNKLRVDTIYTIDGPAFAALRAKLVDEDLLRTKTEIELYNETKKAKKWLAISIVEAILLAIAVFAWFRK